MTHAATDPTQFAVFAPITKFARQPDGSLLVHSVVNDETVDDQGEVVAYDAVKAASADYMAWAAVREMHQPSAVGSMVSLVHDDATMTTEGVLRVVDEAAIAKVESGVYKGTSLGGRKRATEMAKVGGRQVRRITAIDWVETSLVDRPSRPTAVLTVLKRSEEDPVTVTDDTLAKAGDPPAPPQPAADAAPAEQPAPEPAPEPEPAKPSGSAVQQANTVVETLVDLMGAADSAGKAKLRTALTAVQGFVTGLVSDVAKVGVTVSAGSPGDAEQLGAAIAAVLAKGAMDDLMSGHMIAESLARLIEQEGSEQPPDTEGVAILQQAMALVEKFNTREAGEIGTPEEPSIADVVHEAVEDAVAEAVWSAPFAYAAVSGDLAKRAVTLAKAGARNSASDQSTIDQIHDLSVAAGASTCPSVAKAASVPGAGAPATVPGWTPEDIADMLLAKITASAPFATAAEVAAMKAETLGALQPLKEQLAKVAATPMPGGPLRYADDPRTLFRDAPAETREGLSEAISKVSAMPGLSPAVRDELARLDATADVREILRGRS